MKHYRLYLPQVGLEMYTVVPCGKKRRMNSAPKRSAPVPDMACDTAICIHSFMLWENIRSICRFGTNVTRRDKEKTVCCKEKSGWNGRVEGGGAQTGRGEERIGTSTTYPALVAFEGIAEHHLHGEVLELGQTVDGKVLLVEILLQHSLLRLLIVMKEG